MPYVEMVIDSIRHAMHKDEWVILLKDKAGQQYLPVYVDKASADMIARALRDELCEEILDDEIEKMLAADNEVALVIDSADDGFKARFVGQGVDVEYPVGKGLAVATRGGYSIWCLEPVF